MKRFLFGLLLGLPVLCSAQSNFQKGYVVVNVKDTLRGYLDYKESSYNPASVTFKTNMGSNIQTFTTKNSSAWSIDGLEVYQRNEVDITTSTINVSNLSIGPDQTVKRDTVFLKVLQTGKNVTLFSYTDQVKKRFYLLEKGSATPYELVRQLYLDSTANNMMTADKKYIRQLALVMNRFNVGTAIERQKLRDLRYEQSYLMNIVSIINEQQPVKSRHSATRYFAGAGLNISKGAYTGENDLAGPGAKNKISYSPLLTAGVDLFANPAIGKVIYRAELSLLTSKNEISVNRPDTYISYISHSFDQMTVALTPQLIYNIYNTNRIKAFIGGGLGLNFSAYKNNRSTSFNSFRNETTTTDNAVDLTTFNLSIPFSAGIVLNKKVEISVGYTFLTSSIIGSMNYGVNVKHYRIGVNYLFGKL